MSTEIYYFSWLRQFAGNRSSPRRIDGTPPCESMASMMDRERIAFQAPMWWAWCIPVYHKGLSRSFSSDSSEKLENLEGKYLFSLWGPLATRPEWASQASG